MLVEIRVKGNIDLTWSDWLGGLTIKHVNPEETLLKGTVVDQASLYGLLTKLRDLNLALISVVCIDEEGTAVHFIAVDL